MGWAAAIPIIAAVAGPLMNKMMGGNSGSESTKMQPADWQNEDAKALYENVLKTMNDPSFQQRFQGDADWMKAADIGYGDRTDQSLEGYLGVLKRMQEYEKGAQRQGMIGGSPIDILPRSAQNISDRMGTKGQDIFGKTMAQETLRNSILNKNTPNKGFMDWFKFVQDQANKENLARYQLQNTESTAQYNEGIDTAGLLKALTPLFTEGGGQGGGQGTSNFNVNFSDPNYEFPSFT